MAELSDEEEADIKRRVEQLHYAGFKTMQIAKIVGHSQSFINRLKKEIIFERRNSPVIGIDATQEAINRSNRLLEEAWLNYTRSEDKDKALNTLLKVEMSVVQQLTMFDIVHKEPDKIDITSKGQQIEMTQLMKWIRTIHDENKSQSDKHTGNNQDNI